MNLTTSLQKLSDIQKQQISLSKKKIVVSLQLEYYLIIYLFKHKLLRKTYPINFKNEFNMNHQRINEAIKDIVSYNKKQRDINQYQKRRDA